MWRLHESTIQEREYCGKENANSRSMKVKEQRKKDDPSNNPKEDDDLSTERDAMRKKRDQSGSDTILELVKLKLKLDEDGDERKKKRVS